MDFFHDSVCLLRFFQLNIIPGPPKVCFLVGFRYLKTHQKASLGGPSFQVCLPSGSLPNRMSLVVAGEEEFVGTAGSTDHTATGSAWVSAVATLEFG